MLGRFRSSPALADGQTHIPHRHLRRVRASGDDQVWKTTGDIPDPPLAIWTSASADPYAGDSRSRGSWVKRRELEERCHARVAPMHSPPPSASSRAAAAESLAQAFRLDVIRRCTSLVANYVVINPALSSSRQDAVRDEQES